MTTLNEKATILIQRLKTYNEWRRGAEIEMPDPKQLGEEIEGEPYYLTNTVLSVYDKLSEWMFDFHGLIDADLALPVTEEFNPYKL